MEKLRRSAARMWEIVDGGWAPEGAAPDGLFTAQELKELVEAAVGGLGGATLRVKGPVDQAQRVRRGWAGRGGTGWGASRLISALCCRPCLGLTCGITGV